MPPRPRSLPTLVALLAMQGCGYYGYEPRSDASVDAGADAGVDAGHLCDDGACRRVFVTGGSYTSAEVLGLSQADASCQARADAASLGGTWRAWLSDGVASPATRFVRASVPYRLVDGTKVADGWDDLVDGSLDHAIDVFESGDRLLAVGEVWTGTGADGATTSDHCDAWTFHDHDGPHATVGVTVSGAGWSNVYQQFCDRADPRLYCFEQ